MNGIKSSSGIRVRDMVRRYDTAIKSDSSIAPSKSSYFGINAVQEEEFDDLYADETIHSPAVQGSPESPSISSIVRKSRSPRFEDFNDTQAIPLDTQKSFMNLSRPREPPRAAPREKKIRHSHFQLDQQHNVQKLNARDASYQSKTTISKTPNGVRIIVDIFFDQNKGLAIEDFVASRIETDIPPSKILNEFQKRVSETSQD